MEMRITRMGPDGLDSVISEGEQNIRITLPGEERPAFDISYDEYSGGLVVHVIHGIRRASGSMIVRPKAANAVVITRD